ncbi:MAG: dihydrodipicolinate synthase family protein [Jatrophihabitans sp.]
MRAAAMRIGGLIPVLATPFTEDGEVDLRSLTTLTEFQVGAGADGVALFGHASEGFSLTTVERAEILKTVRAAVPDPFPIVAGVSATGTGEAVELADRAADGGAAALMVLPPHMVAPSPDQLVDFYAAVAAAGVPVMVQDAPGNSRVSMSVELITRLAEVDGVDSVKVETQPTTPKVADLVAAAPAGFDVFGGQNALFCLEEYDRGAVGTMPAGEFTDLLRPVLDAFVTGDRAGARAGFTALLPLIRFGLQPGLAWAVHKQVMVARGLIATATVRAPAQPLDESASRWLADLLDDLGLGGSPQ